jgi:hypothetical protein
MTELPLLRNYVDWHRQYDDPDTALSHRLRCVQEEIVSALDATSPCPVRVISICAGDGRDLLDVLARRVDATRVSGELLEILPELVEVATGRLRKLGLSAIEAQCVDASHTSAYDGLAPADLLIVSGVMGNLSPTDVQALVAFTASLCAPGAFLIWNRSSKHPDLGDEIRRWFDGAGFQQRSLHEELGGTTMRVGVERYAGPTVPRSAPHQLFTFLQ